MACHGICHRFRSCRFCFTLFFFQFLDIGNLIHARQPKIAIRRMKANEYYTHIQRRRKKNQVIFLSFCSLNAHLLWCSLIKTKTYTHTYIQKRSFRQLAFHAYYGLWNTQKLIIIARKRRWRLYTNWGWAWSLQSRYMLKFMIRPISRVFFSFGRFLCVLSSIENIPPHPSKMRISISAIV